MSAAKCKCGFLPSGGMEWNKNCPVHGKRSTHSLQRTGYTARLEQLKAEQNERRLTEIAAMLDNVGVPEWVENNSHRGVPSNSAVMRLKWYLARRKNVSPREIDQKLQREMKEAEASAREYMERYNAEVSDRARNGGRS